MLEENTADLAAAAPESYLAADKDHDTNREILESGDYFQSAEVIIFHYCAWLKLFYHEFYLTNVSKLPGLGRILDTVS